MMPFFADLVIRTDESRRAFETHPVLLDAVANGVTVDRYRKFLLELYHVVWHFNPVCAAAASRIPDPLRQVRYFLYEHVHEESGHEDWVLNDLVAVGVPAETVRAHQPSTYTMTLTGYNYWAADRRHPCSVLGMMYTLEVIASVYGGPFSSAVKESLLLESDRGTSFLGSHATMDAQHMAELRKLLNTIDDEAVRDAVAESVIVNFHHFTRVLESV
jgi:pyrroloquinoline quinone (PQQ) biosynthesis protein C